MKLWSKDTIPDHKVIEFTSGADRQSDMNLAEWDIAGSMAHAIMLSEAGLISREEKESLIKTLQELFSRIEKGTLVIGDGIEDIHSQIEKELVSVLGDAGKKIHTGRSRNDQVLVDLRMYSRWAIDSLAEKISLLFSRLIFLSEKYKSVLLPGYTHMQPAMASSFGLWFGSYAESLADDILLLGTARIINNRNPLGTGAGYGSTLPLNRKLTTELLEFDDLLYNSAYASLNRGKAEHAVAAALASLAQTLSRLSMDVCLFMTAEFRFIDFPDEFLTGSSIMPQKRNPDVFELVRGRTNLLQSLPSSVSAIIAGLPSGYNRELQLLKQLLFNAFADIKECVEILEHMLGNIIIREDILSNPVYNSIYSTEEVNRLVRQGIPFRDAYMKVSEMVGKGVFPETKIEEYSHEGSIGNLCNKEIEGILAERMKSFNSRPVAVLIDKLIKYSIS